MQGGFVRTDHRFVAALHAETASESGDGAAGDHNDESCGDDDIALCILSRIDVELIRRVVPVASSVAMLL